MQKRDTRSSDVSESRLPLSRREAALGALAAGLAAGLAADGAHAGGGGHEHHHHHGGPRHQALIDSALKCINRGEVCIEHCMQLLGTGDTSLKDCIRSVSGMLPMCAALVRLGALDAKRLKALARVCIDVCADCEEECKKHDKHAQCRDCAESCAECIKECKRLTDA